MDKPIYRIAVCEDEKILRTQLENIISRIAQENRKECRIAGFETGGALLKAVCGEGDCFDLIFLDILMDGMDGMETARALQKEGIRAKIVFVTSSPDFVFKGYEVGAFRYLLKPYQEGEIKKVLMECFTQSLAPKDLVIQNGAVLRRIPFRDICYVEAQRKTSVVFLDTEAVPVPYKISEIGSGLPEEAFFRCQKSFIVNLEQITTIRRYEATLRGGKVVPVSRAKWTELREKLIGHLSR